MKITDIKIHKLEDNKTKALVSITLDNCFVITGLKIVEGNNGLFIAMPNRKTSSSEYKDTIYPITKEFRQELQEAIINDYNCKYGSNNENGTFITIDDDSSLPF